VTRVINPDGSIGGVIQAWGPSSGGPSSTSDGLAYLKDDTNNGMALAGVLPPGMNGPAIYAKWATRGAPPTNISPPQNPVWPQGQEPPIGGRDLEATDAFEKMIHGLMLLLEDGGTAIETIFVVMPAEEVCNAMHNCGVPQA
jgi:hypothetical protein